jgi:hypothetical protein
MPDAVVRAAVLELGAREQAAIADLIACFREGLTGTLEIAMKDGVPQRRKKTDTLGFGGSEGHRLTNRGK